MIGFVTVAALDWLNVAENIGKISKVLGKQKQSFTCV